MNRRAFLGGLVATASGLLVPEPTRAYSFLPSRLWPAPTTSILEDIKRGIELIRGQTFQYCSVGFIAEMRALTDSERLRHPDAVGVVAAVREIKVEGMLLGSIKNVQVRGSFKA